VIPKAGLPSAGISRLNDTRRVSMEKAFRYSEYTFFNWFRLFDFDDVRIFDGRDS
jgi:hypothetical protein